IIEATSGNPAGPASMSSSTVAPRPSRYSSSASRSAASGALGSYKPASASSRSPISSDTVAPVVPSAASRHTLCHVPGWAVPFAEYKRLLTEAYDLDKPEAPEQELARWMQFAREAYGPVLEVMCGSGRFLVPLARAGIDIDGVDASDDMLAACSQRC